MISGVDIGGTKTHLRVSLGDEIQDQILSTSEWRVAGNDADAAALLDRIKTLAGGVPLALGIGAHGCDTDADCKSFQKSLERLTNIPLRVVNDAELMVPAAGLTDGIGLVIGTGSIAVARTDVLGMTVAGGWGWILGDEGGASGLVRESAKAVRNAIDLGQQPDCLYDLLRDSFGATNFTEFGRALESQRGAANWGRHAEAVFAAAAAGSSLANNVLREAAGSLVRLIERLRARGVPHFDIVAGGGVIVAQPMLRELLREELARRLPQHRLTILEAPPVAGAVAMAAALLQPSRSPAEATLR